MKHSIEANLFLIQLDSIQQIGSKVEILDVILYFCNYRNILMQPKKQKDRDALRHAQRFAAIGNEARLRIVQVLLKAHPEGLVVNEIQGELGIPGSTLSHHLDKLKNEDLVNVQRESTFLRYTANTDTLREMMQFLYAECCTRNQVIRAEEIVEIGK